MAGRSLVPPEQRGPLDLLVQREQLALAGSQGSMEATEMTDGRYLALPELQALLVAQGSPELPVPPDDKDSTVRTAMMAGQSQELREPLARTVLQVQLVQPAPLDSQGWTGLTATTAGRYQARQVPTVLQVPQELQEQLGF